jgi:hypothetical protein
MQRFKKGLRLLLLILCLILAAFGIGITGNFLNNNRERYMNNETKTERADKRDEEEDDDELKN